MSGNILQPDSRVLGQKRKKKEKKKKRGSPDNNLHTLGKDDFDTQSEGGAVQLPHLLTTWALIALWAAAGSGFVN